MQAAPIRTLISTLVAGLALGAAPLAQAYNETYFDGEYLENGTSVRADSFYDPSGAQVGVPYGSDPNYAGYARAPGPAASGGMGGYATVDAPTTAGDVNESYAYSQIYMGRQVTALPGSGLSVGDPVQLELDIRIDGLFDWGVIDNRPLMGDVSGTLAVWSNLSVNVSNDSLWTGYNFWLDLTKDLVGLIADDGTPMVFSDPTIDTWEFFMIDNSEMLSTIDSGSLGADYIDVTDFLDSGLLTFVIDARVGDTIDLWGDLDVVASLTAETDGGGWMWVEADFLNTLNFTLHPLTPGVVVPVPAAVWLFGSGLLGLVAVARRRRA